MHCTHGFNRTGFLIASYLIQELDSAPDAAAWSFSQHRAGGIYKPEYMQELCLRFDGDIEDMPPAEPPAWGATDEDFFAAVKALLENLNRQSKMPIEGEALEETSRLVENAVAVIPDDSFHSALEMSGWYSSKFEESITEENRALLVECLEQAHLDRIPDDVPGSNMKDEARARKKAENDESDAAVGRGSFAIAGPWFVPTAAPTQGRIRKRCRELIGGAPGSGFPGQQPVSMDASNCRAVVDEDYLLSWKADGTRYLMYIDNGKVFMIGRDNCVFEVPFMYFPNAVNNGFVKNTLLDGELVCDTCWVKGPKGDAVQIGQWNYYAYDAVHCYEKSLAGRDYNYRRSYLEQEVIRPRQHFARKEMKDPKIEPPKITPPSDIRTFIKKKRPPFGVKMKEFIPVLGSISDMKEPSGFDIIMERMKQSEEARVARSMQRFPKQIEHGMDGLIFASVAQVYERGSCASLLKWKPPEKNTIDFLFKVHEEERQGKTIYVATLFVNHDGGQVEFTNFGVSTIKSVNKDLKTTDGKIVECSWDKEKRKWKMDRIRTDKTHANSLNTAQNVHRSITDGIKEEQLNVMIKKRRLGKNMEARKMEQKNNLKRKREHDAK